MKEDAFALSAVPDSVVSSAPALYVVADTTKLTGPQGKLKRAMDVALSGLAILALSPLLLVIALLVKRSGRGPVLFRAATRGQERSPPSIS